MDISLTLYLEISLGRWYARTALGRFIPVGKVGGVLGLMGV